MIKLPSSPLAKENLLAQVVVQVLFLSLCGVHSAKEDQRCFEVESDIEHLV